MYLELFSLLDLPLVCNISSRSPLSMALPCGVGIPNVSNAVRSFPGSNPNAGLWFIYTVKKKKMKIKLKFKDKYTSLVYFLWTLERMKLILQGNLSKPNPEENGILHN